MEKDYYRVQSLYEGSFLLARGYALAGKEKAGNKVTILFEDTKEVKKTVLEFYNGAEIGAKALFDCYRSLKDYVFER